MAVIASFHLTALLTLVKLKAEMNSQTAAIAIIQLGRLLSVNNCASPNIIIAAATIYKLTIAPPAIAIHIGDSANYTPATMLSTLAVLDCVSSSIHFLLLLTIFMV